VPLHPSELEASANDAHKLNAPLVLNLLLAAALAQPQTLVVDLDADHHLDTVVLTQTQKQIEITVSYADPRFPREVFRFVVDPNREDAVCAVPVYLKRESAHGFVVKDNTCDSLHFSFNRKKNRLEYWRL
jgi:hypothetical protein